jgi:ABC-type multidrug transport system ATPase subunit
MSIHTAGIEVAEITKSYADHVVLSGIDLAVPAGTVYALLGPNGAGKTTLVRILSTLITADAGEARVARPAQHGLTSVASIGRTPRGMAGPDVVVRDDQSAAPVLIRRSAA